MKLFTTLITVLGLFALPVNAHPELLQSTPTAYTTAPQAPAHWQFRLYMPARLVKATVQSSRGEQQLVIAEPQLHSYWKEFSLPLPDALPAGCYLLQAQVVGRDAIPRQIQVPFGVASRCPEAPQQPS